MKAKTVKRKPKKTGPRSPLGISPRRIRVCRGDAFASKGADVVVMRVIGKGAKCEIRDTTAGRLRTIRTRSLQDVWMRLGVIETLASHRYVAHEMKRAEDRRKTRK